MKVVNKASLNTDIIHTLLPQLIKSAEVGVSGHLYLPDGRRDHEKSFRNISQHVLRWELIKILRSGKADEMEDIIIELENETRMALKAVFTKDETSGIGEFIKLIARIETIEVRDSPLSELLSKIFPVEEGYKIDYEDFLCVEIPVGIHEYAPSSFEIRSYSMYFVLEEACLRIIFPDELELDQTKESTSPEGVRLRKFLSLGWKMNLNALEKSWDFNDLEGLKKELEIVKNILIE